MIHSKNIYKYNIGEYKYVLKHNIIIYIYDVLEWDEELGTA